MIVLYNIDRSCEEHKNLLAMLSMIDAAFEPLGDVFPLVRR